MRKLIALAIALLVVSPASADDVWLGLYRHDVIINEPRYEGGEDIKAGWIGNPIRGLHELGSPSPHVIVSKHLNGLNDYLAAGFDWTLGTRFYVRPGIGLAVNDGKRPAYRGIERMDLGSPVTFEPEFAFGWRTSPRVRIEASWIHLSHAQLFSHQNRGLDSWGVRTLLRLR